MKLKNKDERVQFIQSYKDWQLLYDLKEIKVKVYKKQLNTGAILYATEYSHIGYRNEIKKNVRYHLIVSKKDEYLKKSCCGDEYLMYYGPAGDSITTLVDYLTKYRDVIDV